MTDTPNITGEFGPGAMGPTIFMVLSSPTAAGWLRGLFVSMIGSQALVDLSGYGEVELCNIEAMQLTRVARRHGAQLSKNRQKNAFLWQCDDDEWQANAELLDPFVAGRTGHQYLTQAGVDDAVVEISFGEPEVQAPGNFTSLGAAEFCQPGDTGLEPRRLQRPFRVLARHQSERNVCRQ